MKSPLNTGPLHFIGIGGIGMSGIAEVLLNLGYNVQGSDTGSSPLLQKLTDHGAKIFSHQSSDNITDDLAVVVISTAIKPDNPEYIAARHKKIPIIKRAEMLAELMRLKRGIAISGTHGKTTTTSLVGTLLDAGGLDPTIVNGGVINSLGTNACLGVGDWIVVEADESDGSFLNLSPEIAIVTNIDPEHLDYYKNFEAITQAFRAFLNKLPFYGFAVVCIDHPAIQTLISLITDRRIITYGEHPLADAHLTNFCLTKEHATFDVTFRLKNTPHIMLPNITLPMLGKHNALNAVAAIAVAHNLGINPKLIYEALASFKGVKRRFTRTAIWNNVSIFDDYGHHPVEIKAVLEAARSCIQNKIIAIIQPHRYTRVASLFEEFSSCLEDADIVIVADIYPAGEAPIPGINQEALVKSIRDAGHPHVIALQKETDLPMHIWKLATPGDYVIFLGAGTITQWANSLHGELINLEKQGHAFAVLE